MQKSRCVGTSPRLHQFQLSGYVAMLAPFCSVFCSVLVERARVLSFLLLERSSKDRKEEHDNVSGEGEKERGRERKRKRKGKDEPGYTAREKTEKRVA